VIFLSLAITIVAEAVPVTALLMGSADLKALFGSSNMLTEFVTRFGGEKLNIVVSLGVALAIFNALIAMVLMCSRVFYSSGRDNVWAAPISRALARVHARFHSPWVATFVFGALGLAACFVDQKLLFVIIGTSIVVIYIVMCLAVIMGRMNGTTKHAAYRMPLFPLPPILGLFALGYIIYANYLDEAVGRPSLWATAAMIVGSLLYYVVVLRRRGGWQLYNPVSDAE
jgi:amino acid transporter